MKTMNIYVYSLGKYIVKFLKPIMKPSKVFRLYHNLVIWWLCLFNHRQKSLGVRQRERERQGEKVVLGVLLSDKSGTEPISAYSNRGAALAH